MRSLAEQEDFKFFPLRPTRRHRILEHEVNNKYHSETRDAFTKAHLHKLEAKGPMSSLNTSIVRSGHAR